jgi:vacuolar-type H+-ATPase subunit F/Vma7
VTVANKISVIIDVAVDKGVTSLKKFRSAIGEAETASGKMRAGFDVAKESIVANAANIAMAAGGALIAFGVKAVSAFQDTALAAGKFSDATGLAVDEASRFIEVAGDIGIEAGTVETALGKMNKTLGGSPELFAELGVEIAKTGTGATDVNGTFLNVVDRLNAIKDPAERARVASQLLGKGWQGMAELIGQGSTALKASLAGVADAQVIDEKELKKAREFRDRMDQLKDQLSAVALELGESLVPALTQMAENAVPAAQAVAKVADAWMTVGKAVKNTAEVSAEMYLQNGLTVDQLKEMGYSADEVSDALVKLGLSTVETTDVTDEMARMYGQRLNPTVEDTTQVFDAAAEEANSLAIKTGRVERAAEALSAEWDRLKGKIDDKAAWFNMQATFDDIRDKGAAAMQAVADGTEDAEQKMHEYRDAVIGGQQEVFDLGKQLGLLPDEVSVLIDLAENGQIDELERRLTILTRNRTANLDIIARGGAGYGDRFGGARAAGGPVTAGTPYLVGEKGPEIVVPGRSGTVIPNNRIGVGGGGGMVINITTGADPQAVIAAIKKFEKSNGAAWRS